jgi:uncharacterized protein (DUF1499 family)
MGVRAAATWLGRLGAVVAALCVVAILLAGLGHRLGWWDYRVGLTILRWGAWTGLGAAIASLLGLAAPGRGRWLAAGGVLVGALVFGLPWSVQQRRPEGPPMHDITTDMANPPAYVAILPLRRNAPNKAEYEGATAAAAQRKAHPEIGPAVLPLPPASAFERSLQAARALGWEIVAAVPAEGRIEATDTTLLFGFKDDVVIRVVAEGAGSRVDVRSASRVGRSDFGTNARRVRTYLDRLQSLSRDS